MGEYNLENNLASTFTVNNNRESARGPITMKSVDQPAGSGYMWLVNNRERYGRPRMDWVASDLDIIWSHVKPPCCILDYGCGNGSLGFLGTSNDLGGSLVIDGMDENDPDNHLALYHDRGELDAKRYDLIVARHSLEHMRWGKDGGEIRDFLVWAYQHSDQLITVTPNETPYYNFWEDPTHKTKLANTFYLALCESTGWKILDVVISDVRLGSRLFFLPRLVYSLMQGVPPLFSHIVVMGK